MKTITFDTVVRHWIEMGSKVRLVRFAKTTYNIVPDGDWPEDEKNYPVNNVRHEMKASLHEELFGRKKPKTKTEPSPDSAKDGEPAESKEEPWQK